MHNEDHQLILKTKQGDEEAFALLVGKYKQRAFGVAYHFLGNAEEAREIIQEVFVKVYCSLDKFQGTSSFYTWFYRILVNQCIDYKRKRKLDTIPFSQLEKSGEGNAMSFSDRVVDKHAKTPQEEMLTNEMNQQIDHAIEKLPAQQKKVFILRNYEKLSLLEIANVLQCAEGTVKSHLSRAMHNLQDFLKNYIQGSLGDGGVDHETV